MDSTHSWRRFRGSGQPDFRAPIEVWKIGLSEQLVSRSLNPELNDLSVSERNKAAQGAATSHFRMNSPHTAVDHRNVVAFTRDLATLPADG